MKKEGYKYTQCVSQKDWPWLSTAPATVLCPRLAPA